MARRKEFDREVVLERAMDLFWHKGYEATSVQDLVGQMGISRGSLYDTFGDKHSLFIAVLDRYREATATKMLQGLENPDAGLEAIRQFFNAIVLALSSQTICKGCLVVNSMVELASHDPQAARLLRAHLSRMERAFYRALRRARSLGEISDRHDLHALAQFLIGTASGLSVVAKTSPNPQVLQNMVDVALASLE